MVTRLRPKLSCVFFYEWVSGLAQQMLICDPVKRLYNVHTSPTRLNYTLLTSYCSPLRSKSSLLRRKLKRTGHCPFLSLSLSLSLICTAMSCRCCHPLPLCSLLAWGHSPVCVSCFTCCPCPCWLWHTLQKAKPSKQRGMSTMEGEWERELGLGLDETVCGLCLV